MCTSPITIRVPPNTYEQNILGLSSLKEVKVPCGKCPECLKKRQNDIAVRAYREANKFGSCYFVTLTYKPDCVPFAKTLLDINEDTGEVLKHEVASLCEEDLSLSLRDAYKKYQRGSVFYYYQDVFRFSFNGVFHTYQMVCTPTLYQRHVSLCIKLFRVRYQREFGEKLKFTYICVGEYGSKPNGTHRPHYHILFFGLDYKQINYFCRLWSYGFSYVEAVNFRNDDGSDGLAKVASYIGKYASKGSFNPSSVTSHLVIPNRVCSSRGLGLDSLDNLYSYYRGYDIVGKYDIELMDIPSDKKYLLFSTIFNRLKYEFNGVQISLPISLRRKIFGFRLFDGRGVWSRLYYEVMAFARSQFEDIRDEEFRKFCSLRLGVPLTEVVAEFEHLQEVPLQLREKAERERLKRFYSRSKF